MSQDKIQVPDNFKNILLEVVDPNQSIDYFDSGNDATIPVTVLPISLERKVALICSSKLIQSEERTERACAEIFRFHCGVQLNWARNNFTLEEMKSFLLLQVEKCKLNDIVIEVVHEVERSIDWTKPTDEESSKSQKYKVSSVFNDSLQFVSYSSESYLAHDFVKNTSRGLRELMRLTQLISSDRIRSDSPVKHGESKQQRGTSKKMKDASTMEDYLAGIAEQGAEQGVDMGALFRTK